MTRRRYLEIGLGALWLLDGALQLQPHMFTAAFFSNTLGMGNMGVPAPAARFDYRVTTLLVAHPVPWNALFAGLQLAIGVSLLRGGRAAALARPVSLVWALAVWYIGEGFGGMFMGGASILNGAPGPALGYALLTLAVWPRRRDASTYDRILDDSFHRRVLAVWSTLWLSVALLETAGTNRMPFVPGAEIRNSGTSEPSWLAALDRSVGNVVGLHGALFAAVFGSVAATLALAPWLPSFRRPSLLLGAAVGVFLGLVGGGFGGLVTGAATDPGLAAVFVLAAVGAWPTDVAEWRGVRARSGRPTRRVALGRLPSGEPQPVPAA